MVLNKLAAPEFKEVEFTAVGWVDGRKPSITFFSQH